MHLRDLEVSVTAFRANPQARGDSFIHPIQTGHGFPPSRGMVTFLLARIRFGVGWPTSSGSCILPSVRRAGGDLSSFGIMVNRT